jgi:hypothetical protein
MRLRCPNATYPIESAAEQLCECNNAATLDARGRHKWQEVSISSLQLQRDESTLVIDTGVLQYGIFLGLQLCQKHSIGADDN